MFRRKDALVKIARTMSNTGDGCSILMDPHGQTSKQTSGPKVKGTREHRSQSLVIALEGLTKKLA
jgi:hypothetical protein